MEITLVKFLKMYYTPVTKSALNMIYCVEVLGIYRLFVYGDLVCYTPWQVVIIAVILPGILLFPVSFELAVRLLKRFVVVVVVVVVFVVVFVVV